MAQQVSGQQTGANKASWLDREAFLGGRDLTNGATHFNMRPRPDRSNWKFPNGTTEGLALSTQSGPYDNSFPNRNAPAHYLVKYVFPGRERQKDTTKTLTYLAI